MRISELSDYFARLEKTASRNEMTAILSQLFQKADWREIDKICYLVSGKLVPAYKGIEFNLAEKMMVRILAQGYDRPAEKVLALYKKKGDLGDVAAELAESPKFKAQSSKSTVAKVYERLMEIAQEVGEGSQERKITKMVKLLAALDPLSAKYVARIPVGNLRLGFSDITMLDALSVMVQGDKSARPDIERAYNVTADIGRIAQRIKKDGLAGIKRVEAIPGAPIRPSMAERLPSAQKIVEKAGPRVAVEPKLDGFRTQIHIWQDPPAGPAPSGGGAGGGKKQIAIFSRNLENITYMFPEIVAAAKKIPVKDAILDGEAIGYNPATGRFLPFQETVQRKRKYDIEAMAKKLPLAVFVFDILLLDGKTLLSLPFSQRRKILEKTLAGKENGLKLTPQIVTADPNVINDELEENIKTGLEGLVAKKYDAPYQAGARGFHWIKLKGTTAALEKLRAGEKGVGRQKGLLDTVDCVVMGAYKGRGKRAAFGVGGFLLGVRGEDGRFYTISKLGSGLSDEQFREANRRVEKLKVKNQPKDYQVVKEKFPDIWTRPALVVEILADEITLSPHHTAGVKAGRGYSLRFPRLVRLRDDKNPEDATTVKEVARLFKTQGRS